MTAALSLAIACSLVLAPVDEPGAPRTDVLTGNAAKHVARARALMSRSAYADAEAEIKTGRVLLAALARAAF